MLETQTISAPGHTLLRPGNAGTNQLAINIDIKPTDIAALTAFAKNNKIGLTIVGPEAPLVAGIVDEFEKAGLRIFGTSQRASQIEGSKAYAKLLMRNCKVPTAPFEVFIDYEKALAHLNQRSLPLVLKANGLAAGKGVIVCQTLEQAREELRAMMPEGKFKNAGSKVVIEDCLVGQEISVMTICHGTEFIMLLPSQDHKPVGNNDTGPNTGGMGAYAPVPWVTQSMLDEISRRVFTPILKQMAESDHTFVGCLYAGLMITESGPQVLEFNCRFGDPEIQTVLPLLKSDLLEIIILCLNNNLSRVQLEWQDKFAVCTMLVSDGYPGKYETGLEISRLAKGHDLYHFHSGTKRDENGQLVTNGGRVIGETALNADLATAIRISQQAAGLVVFEGKSFRSDIGRKGLTTPSFLTTSP